jgi:hypothetical protein
MCKQLYPVRVVCGAVAAGGQVGSDSPRKCCRSSTSSPVRSLSPDSDILLRQGQAYIREIQLSLSRGTGAFLIKASL